MKNGGVNSVLGACVGEGGSLPPSLVFLRMLEICVGNCHPFINVWVSGPALPAAYCLQYKIFKRDLSDKNLEMQG